MARKQRKRRVSFWTIVCVVLSVYLVVIFVQQTLQMRALSKSLNDVSGQLKTIQDKNTELQTEIDRLQTDSYIEELARRVLGWVRPDDIVITPVVPTSP
jgi:cell division protein FtsB/cell division protein DivIC